MHIYIYTDLVVQGLKGDIEGARMELEHMDKVAARRLRIVEDLSEKFKDKVVKQLFLEESKALAELKITKKKMRSLKQEKKRNLLYKRKRVDELMEEAKEWRNSSIVAANMKPEVKLGNKAGGRGDPFNDRFEAQIRRQMATGVSAEHCRLLLDLNADLMYGEGTEERKAFVTPCADWFSKQREAVGNISYVHAMLKIASADFVKQHGYDETGIDRISTMNQWVLLEKDGGHEIVSLETGGVLIGGTAQECADHIEKVWRRGQECIDLVIDKLTAEYGAEVAAQLVQIENGGVQLLKLMSEMHDTCNTANAVVPILGRKKEANGKAVLGEEAWAALPEEKRSLGDWLCGNHTRGLPVDAFNRNFEGCLRALPPSSARNFRSSCSVSYVISASVCDLCAAWCAFCRKRSIKHQLSMVTSRSGMWLV